MQGRCLQAVLKKTLDPGLEIITCRFYYQGERWRLQEISHPVFEMRQGTPRFGKLVSEEIDRCDGGHL